MKARTLAGAAALVSFLLFVIGLGSAFYETDIAKEIFEFTFLSGAITWLPLLATALMLLWLRLREFEHRQAFASQFATIGNARARDGRTVEGDIEGSYFGYRVWSHEGQHWTTLFVETANPPVEFMIEEAGPIASLMSGLVEQFRIFETHNLVAGPLTGNHIFRTDDATGLQKLLNDDAFLRVLSNLKARPGFRFLLAAKIPESATRLVRDGLGELVPFRGRPGLALMRQAEEAVARRASDVEHDVTLLKEAFAALSTKSA